MRTVRTRIVAALAAAAAFTAVIGVPATAAREPAGAGGVTGFQPTSTSWTSPQRGWTFGYAPCDTGQCPTLLRTDDAGQTWDELSAPNLPPSEYGYQSRVVFVERHRHTVGVATNGETLAASFDGGRTWQEQELPGADTIGAIDATDTAVYVGVHSRTPDGVRVRFYSSPINGPRWRPVRELDIAGAGDLGSTMSGLSTHGRALQAAAATYGGEVAVWSSDNGHRFTAAAPCESLAATHIGMSDLAHQFALCTSNPGRGTSAKQLMFSADGGDYTARSVAPELGITSDFAVADDGRTLAVGATGGDMGIVYMSYDGGHSWEATMAEPSTGPVLDLQFQDSQHATLVTGYTFDGSADVYRTVDGGRTWVPLGM